MLKQTLNRFSQIFRLILLWIVFLTFHTSISQAGPYTYFAPHGNDVYTSASSGNHNYQYTSMDRLSNLSDNTTGLVAEANFEVVRNNERLLRFSTSKGDLLDIFYENETMLLRRYYNNGTHFDYILFDPLFRTSGYTPIDAVWTVRCFFTAHFMWIEVQLNQTPLPTTSQYLSLTYFGLDYDFSAGSSNMSEFLTRQNSARITWGSNLNSPAFKVPGVLKIYEFNYNDLSKDIQEKFSYPIQQSAKSSLSKVELGEGNEIQLVENENAGEELTIHRQRINEKLTLYPNPSHDYFTVDINSEEDEKVILTIFDISGRLLYQLEEYLKKGNNTIILQHKDIGILANSEILLLKVKGEKRLDLIGKLIVD